jgi:hypothetical protein
MSPLLSEPITQFAGLSIERKSCGQVCCAAVTFRRILSAASETALALTELIALAPFLKCSLELCDQFRHGFRLLMHREVTAGQPLDLEAGLTIIDRSKQAFSFSFTN